jgi:hypothetical protein
MDEATRVDTKFGLSGKWAKILIAAVIAAWVVAGGFFLLYRNSSKSIDNPSPLASFSQSVKYPLYYPANGYIAPDSKTLTNGTVTYTVKYKDDDMFVSIQPIPKNFDFNNFNRQVTGQTSIRTPVGKAIIGKLAGKLIGSITTDKAWFLISAPPDTPVTDIQDVLQNLKR